MKSTSPRPLSLNISRRSVLKNTLLGALPAGLLAAHFNNVWGARAPSRKEVSDEMVQTANRQFAVRLYTQLAKENAGKNLFMSPLSLSIALTMTMEGARGSTETELKHGLGFAAKTGPFNKEDVHRGMAKIMRSINEEKSYDLHTANALWIENTFAANPEFVATLNGLYDSAIKRANFTGNPNGERLNINKWVAGVTQERIQDLLPPDSIDSLTRFVIANAIYFKADWKNQFTEAMTRKAPFTLADGKRENVDMMSLKGTSAFEYAQLDEAGGIELIELPYKDEAVSMLVVLPKKADGLERVEKEFAEGKLTSWLTKLRRTNLRVQMPKFKLETDYVLNKTLVALGMPSLFQGGLEGMAADTSRGRGLYVSLVKQKAFLEVDEEGTEAAAATAVVVNQRSAIRQRYFLANRPFMFALRDKKTDSILFLGRYSQPNA